jgi:glucosyl-dolichyl phosphate glucuronosyltransferase
MTISVVIATHNRAALLSKALEALRRQEYAPGDEVIVVNNASTDETADVISRAAKGFPTPLHALNESRPGKTAALNTGLAATRSDILALTDDDVRVAGNWIPTIRSLFMGSTLALVGGHVAPDWECEAPRWLRVEEESQYGVMCSPLALLHYGQAQELGRRTVLGANMAIRRTVLQALGDFNPQLTRRPGTLLGGEDHDFCERAVAAGYRCEYRPEMLVRHRVPAERARLHYYLRWFFWSGVTHAMIDRQRSNGRAEPSPSPVPHHLRRLAEAPVWAIWYALTGHTSEAATALVDSAFAAGYIVQRTGRQRCAGTLVSE